jgi:hypothetical protein
VLTTSVNVIFGSDPLITTLGWIVGVTMIMGAVVATVVGSGVATVVVGSGTICGGVLVHPAIISVDATHATNIRVINNFFIIFSLKRQLSLVLLNSHHKHI